MTVDGLREWTRGPRGGCAHAHFASPGSARSRPSCGRIGAGEFVDDICSADPPPQTWSTRFDFAWLKSCLDAAFAEEPALATFSGQSHQAVVDEFKRLDLERPRAGDCQGRCAATRSASSPFAMRTPSRMPLMKREAAKKRRHLPLRKLVAEAPDVLTALHPCWMASPLSVSQLLPGRPAVLRCRHLRRSQPGPARRRRDLAAARPSVRRRWRSEAAAADDVLRGRHRRRRRRRQRYGRFRKPPRRHYVASSICRGTSTGTIAATTSR